MNGQLSSLIQIDIYKPPYFNLRSTALSHGWVNLAPFEWNNSSNSLRVSISNNDFVCSGHISQAGNRLVFVRMPGEISSIDNGVVKQTVERMLSVHQKFETFEEECKKNRNKLFGKMIQLGWGRMLRGGNAWEDAAKTLMTTNASWHHTKKMCQNMCQHIGKQGGFPTPREILFKGKSFLKDKIKMGYRSEYLLDLAVKIEEEGLRLDDYEIGRAHADQAQKVIYSLKGFGPYAANHLLVMLGWYQHLPVDREVMKYLQIKSKNGRCPKVIQNYSEWGDHKFLAYKLTRISKRRNWIGD